MNSLDYTNICHINVCHDVDVPTRQKVDIIDKFFKEIEWTSKRTHSEYQAVVMPINKKEAFVAFLSGNDMFLGVYNKNTSALSNNVNLKSLIDTNMRSLYQVHEDLKKGIRNSNLHISQDIRNAIGVYIPEVKREENFLSNLPRGLSIERTAEPFMLNIRKDPPFNNKDIVFGIDINHRRVSITVDGIPRSMSFLKDNYKRAYDMYNHIIDAFEGRDLSKYNIQNLLDKGSHIQER